MKQSIIENFDPNDLHKFLMQSARENFDEHCNDFNAGMSMMMGLVKKYFCDDFDIPIRENNGWISVDDGLPTNGSICFVLREKIDVSKFPSYIPVPIHLMNSYYCRVDKTIYKDDHFTCDEKSREKVTHWVLAPEEPQE